MFVHSKMFQNWSEALCIPAAQELKYILAHLICAVRFLVIHITSLSLDTTNLQSPN